MIIGVGMDLCEVSRFEDMVHRASPRYYERLLSEPEWRYFRTLKPARRQAQWLAGTFAAKEATLKAAGVGIDGRYAMNRINTVSDSGERQVELPDPLQKALGGSVVGHLSIAFTDELAAALVVLETFSNEFGKLQAKELRG